MTHLEAGRGGTSAAEVDRGRGAEADRIRGEIKFCTHSSDVNKLKCCYNECLLQLTASHQPSVGNLQQDCKPHSTVD